jgi:hypothetical protein
LIISALLVLKTPDYNCLASQSQKSEGGVAKEEKYVSLMSRQMGLKT